MAILIKGMTMPYSCLHCWLNSMQRCRATGGETTWAVAVQKRRGDCPLTKVPEQHGRLIDADALFNGEHNLYSWDEIDEAPTVIPASEEAE